VDGRGHRADLIKGEHPQIIATILVHLEYDQAGEILKHFDERLRNDVVLRIATLDGVQPTALKELNDALTRMLSGANGQEGGDGRGAPRRRDPQLRRLDAETAVIDNVREYDPELAQKILDEMFVFENLIDIDDRGIQTILREVQSDSLIIALKGAPPELREKIFKNMSSRAAEMLREDLEARGPVRLSEVEAEQKEILKTVRRLAEEGQVMLGLHCHYTIAILRSS
jgi:flagellar motor switch protein FliG